MESKVAAGKKASGAINNVSKLSKLSQICHGSRILFLVVVVILFCFLYFDIIQFTSSDGVLLNILPLQTLSHHTAELFIPVDHQYHQSSRSNLRSPSSTIFPPSNPSDYQGRHSLHHPNSRPSPTTDDQLLYQLPADSPISPTISQSNTNPLFDTTPLPSNYDPLLDQSPFNKPISPISISQPNTNYPLLDSTASPTNDQLSDQLPFQNPIISPAISQSDTNPLFDSTPSDNPSTQLSKSTSLSSHSAPSLPPEGATRNPIVSPILPSSGEVEDQEEDTIFERPAGRWRKPGECNLYEGRWVRDESYPLYRSKSCPFIDGGFRCQDNGRPDQDYLKWRWQPSGCNMPRFNGMDLLNKLRGSRLVFVGDSIGRNQWESMLCMLFEAVKNKTRIYEMNGEPITKHKGFLIFRFEAYNCSVEYYRSPFLVPQGRPPSNPPKGVRTTLKVDTMDWTSKRWRGANVIIFNAGHWWSFEKTLRGGCYFQVGNHVNQSMDVREAFGRAMRTWRRWVKANIDPLHTQVFFRTYSPVHFSGGTWKTGGQCHMEREPYPEGSKFGGESWTNGVILSETGMLPDVNLLDVTHLSTYRKDAHSSIYHVGPGDERPYSHQDCSHWCLPGLPDAWNELLYASLLQAGKGNWHSQPLPAQQ